MKVLPDACVPRPLRKFLSAHVVQTAREMGWGQLKNGVLLDEAESRFDVLLTTDQNLKYQQRVTGRRLAILVLPTNDWPTIQSRADEVAAKLAGLRPGDYVELDWG
jgi:predicted nuclease of predicted toxin-antitoxin system